MIEKEWKYLGLRCVVKYVSATPMGDFYCGYVCVTPSHPLYKEDVDSEKCNDICICGGLTYAYPDLVTETKKDGEWWLGFDMANKHFDLEETIEETNRLAEQLSKILNKEE